MEQPTLTDRLRKRLNRAWQWTLKQSFRRPLTTGVTIFAVLLATSLLAAQVVASPEDFITWLDYAGILLGLISICLGWSVGIHLWARRKEAALPSFADAGHEVTHYQDRFQASLILASSRGIQPQWHLRNIKPQRAEFVWTGFTREATRQLLDVYEGITCRFHTHDDANALDDPYDIRQIKNHCRYLLQDILQQGYPRDRVCVDITGGTALMSIGAFQAATDLGVQTIYLLGTAPDRNGNPIIDPERIDSPDAARVIALSGAPLPAPPGRT